MPAPVALPAINALLALAALAALSSGKTPERLPVRNYPEGYFDTGHLLPSEPTDIGKFGLPGQMLLQLEPVPYDEWPWLTRQIWKRPKW